MATSDSIQRARPLLGTIVEIVAGGAAASKLDEPVDAAFDAIAQVHRLMSFHDSKSDVSRLNREAFDRDVAVHAWTYRVLSTALEIHRYSGGLFDITVAPLLQRHGLLPGDPDESFSPAGPSSAAGCIELLDGHRIHYRNRHVRIDLGGIAKGFAVDQALAILRERGVTRGVINAGGDLAAFGPQPERVYVRNPANFDRRFCEVAIANAALASSGRSFDLVRGTDRAGCAIIDPNGRSPVRAVAGATVRAPSCMIADALTKVVMIAGEQSIALLRQYRADALFVLESGDVRITPDWQAAVRFAA